MGAPTGARMRRWGFRALLLASLVGALLAYGFPFFVHLQGRALFVLTSGSMAPVYPAGSAVVGQPITPEQLRVGQTVTFKNSNGDYVTHEIVAFKNIAMTDEDGQPLLDEAGHKITWRYMQTKGAANDTADADLTSVNEVRYLVVDSYPQLGGWLLWSRTLVGRLVLFAPPFLLLLAAEVWSWRSIRPAQEPEEPPSSRTKRHDDVAHAVV